jgi:bud site selection protein 31
MRDAENESHEGKRKSESLWPIMRISHARSRYIYELYYKREAISKELYDWLLKEKYADAKYVHDFRRVALLTNYFPKPGCEVEENWL